MNKGWSNWSEWSRCIGVCKNSIRYRTRICRNRAVEPCKGKSNEYEKCPATSCKRTKRDAGVYNSSSFLRDFILEKFKINKAHESTTGTCNNSILKSNLIKLIERKALKKLCGGIYRLKKNQKVIISSPNYPFQYNKSLICNYLIQVGH